MTPWRGLLAVLGCLVALVSLVCDGNVPLLGHLETVGGIVPGQGHAWQASLAAKRLSEDGHFVTPFLFARPADQAPTPACAAMGPRFAELLPALCPPLWRALGPSRQEEAAVRAEGGGRYALRNGVLLFSTPDGSDPRRNGMVYALWAPFLLAARIGGLAALGFALWAARPLARPAGPLAYYGAALVLLGLVAGIARGGSLVSLAGAAPLLCGIAVLARMRPGRAGLLNLIAGFALTELLLAGGLNAAGFVRRTPMNGVIKALDTLDASKPIVLFIGSSYTAEGIDPDVASKVFAAAGHPVTVARLALGGMTHLERLSTIRKYLMTPHVAPTIVLFEVASYYDRHPLDQLQSNWWSDRVVALMDGETTLRTLDWTRTRDAPTDPWTLRRDVIAQYLLHLFQVGLLPHVERVASVEPAGPDYAREPHLKMPDAEVADRLQAGLAAAEEPADTHDAAPPDWVARILDEEQAAFRAGGTTKFGFYVVPSLYEATWSYGRDFCHAIGDRPCIIPDDRALLDAISTDTDWIGYSHLRYAARQAYTSWLAGRLAVDRRLF